MLAGATAWAQLPYSGASPAIVSTDLAVTYATERAELAPGNCGCSWLQGGSADVAVTFRSGLGIAASVTGDHASNFAPGVDVNKVAFMAGPRYTYTAWTGHAATTDVRRMQLYGQGLFGGVRAFNGIFHRGNHLQRRIVCPPGRRRSQSVLLQELRRALAGGGLR
jgi:hypothetical protein